MSDPQNEAAGAEPPPPPRPVTYTNPQGAWQENLVTDRQRCVARDAVRKQSRTTPRRNSSDQSDETVSSDPKKWFDQANHKESNAMLPVAMDVDPPYFQKESLSSTEELALPPQDTAFNFAQSRLPGCSRPGFAHSSSADDYRSIVDDLTIENKRLREELKRYKHKDPDSLRKEKLFELRIHGLSGRKKRELEAALRDFTSNHANSSQGTSQHKRVKGQEKGAHAFKNASSTTDSNTRPGVTDSAYASMSTDLTQANLTPRSKFRHKSDRTIQRYLQDIPVGLWPQTKVMLEKDKKKLVVKRLEQLFTGKHLDRLDRSKPMMPAANGDDAEMTPPDEKIPVIHEAAREAKIVGNGGGVPHNPLEPESGSNSNGDGTDSKSDGSGSGDQRQGKSTPNTDDSEQRPTRPKDLDPDRVQTPSENLKYIRHLGLIAPEYQRQFSAEDVSPDVEGWVYLNLLCNMAHLHILNVTPAFIRSAVSEKSRSFQLSPDGRKIRWRGGLEGTRFSSDSSGSHSQRENSAEEADEHQSSKRGKTVESAADAEPANPERRKAGLQRSTGSRSFHYKPMFVHTQSSSSETPPSYSDDEAASSDQPAEESQLELPSLWEHGGGSCVPQRKCRRGAAIIYYAGAPFCTDLSGDSGDTSLDDVDSSESSAKQPIDSKTDDEPQRPDLPPIKPAHQEASDGDVMDMDPPVAGWLAEDDSSDANQPDMEASFPWSDSSDASHVSCLPEFEASGLAGITPEDHFEISVLTKRSKEDAGQTASWQTEDLMDVSDGDTTRPLVRRPGESSVRIEYVRDSFKRLAPVPLPPPLYYFCSSCRGSESDESGSEGSESESSASRQRYNAALAQAGNEELSSGVLEDDGSDADDDDDDDDSGRIARGDLASADQVGDLGIPICSPAGTKPSQVGKMATGSWAATAGGAISRHVSMSICDDDEGV